MLGIYNVMKSTSSVSFTYFYVLVVYYTLKA